MKWLEKNIISGRITNHYQLNPEINKEAYNWELCGERLKYLIPMLLPYLVIKKPQALIALQILKTMSCYHSGRLLLYIQEKRRKLAEELRKLNTRGKQGKKINIKENSYGHKNKNRQMSFVRMASSD